MYERGIIELRDVEFIQAWIRDLVQIGYRFWVVCATNTMLI